MYQGDDYRSGCHVKNQLLVWDTLIEWRIRMQKLVSASNRLPQPDSDAVSILIGEDQDPSQSKSKVFQLQKQTKKNVSRLIQSLNSLQDVMMDKGCLPLRKKKPKAIDEDEEDEEILSDEDIESDQGMEDDGELDSEVDEDMSDKEVDESKSKKTKTTGHIDKHEEMLEKKFTSFKDTRNDILDNWYFKTRFSSGLKSSKGMESFEQPPTAQIQAIVSDKKRLLKRTQLKRSEYEIIGKKRKNTEDSDQEEDDQVDSKDKNYDCEIFDDDDFYHQLLRELIANKTSEGSDSLAISKKLLEIQKMRSNMKKKYDSKGNRGRKIKFETHKELVNFMAPIPSFEFTDEAKDELFTSLFQ